MMYCLRFVRRGTRSTARSSAAKPIGTLGTMSCGPTLLSIGVGASCVAPILESTMGQQNQNPNQQGQQQQGGQQQKPGQQQQQNPKPGQGGQQGGGQQGGQQ